MDSWADFEPDKDPFKRTTSPQRIILCRFHFGLAECIPKYSNIEVSWDPFPIILGYLDPLLPYPRGSKYSIFQASGPKSHEG